MTFTDAEVVVIRAGLMNLYAYQTSGNSLPDPVLVALIDRLDPDKAAPEPEPAPAPAPAPAQKK